MTHGEQPGVAGLVGAQTEGPGNLAVVLSAWRRHLETEIIPALPEACEWKWVAVQLRRELARSLPRA